MLIAEVKRYIKGDISQVIAPLRRLQMIIEGGHRESQNLISQLNMVQEWLSSRYEHDQHDVFSELQDKYDYMEEAIRDFAMNPPDDISHYQAIALEKIEDLIHMLQALKSWGMV